MKVGLFIPCYINALYPEVGEASYKLLTQLGVEVDYPLDQTCCGQPMANAGYERDAKALAEVDGRIVAARQDNQLGVTFHPELDEDTRLHELFLQM